jgi:riboflavin synthase
MFTGIVEGQGTVTGHAGRGGLVELSIAAPGLTDGVAVGDSVSVNGACLTVVRRLADGFGFELVPETLRRTQLGTLVPGDRVNLERSLAANGRLGGHFVQGHVDGLGRVASLEPEGEAVLAGFRAPPELLRYVVPKGFVAVDGVSLTVVDLMGDGFRVAFIPFTLQHTRAGGYRLGDTVNLEADILGKYVARFLEARAGEVPT